MSADARPCANNLYPAADMEAESTRHHRPAFHKSSTNSCFICRLDILLMSTSGSLPAAVLLRYSDVGHAVMPSTHKHAFASIIVGTFMGIMYYPASYPNPNHPSSDPNPNLNPFLTPSLKACQTGL